MDLERILKSIELGEQDRVQRDLNTYNQENAQCFFFNVEERERRKRLGQALIQFLAQDLQPCCLLSCLETIRILSRDRLALGPFSSEEGVRTLARLAGIQSADREVARGGGEDVTVSRTEAVKALCNVVYNSQGAQEQACRLRLLSGLAGRLKLSAESRSPPAGQFYDLRLIFLLTALRPELRCQLAREERGVSLLTDVLERALCVRWGDSYEVLTDRLVPPLSQEDSQLAIEILKILFNITCNIHKASVDEEEAALYRHLAAMLRHCLLVNCEGEEQREELQGHTVNVLSLLPLSCLDVLLAVRVGPGSAEYMGINMDCVEALLGFMERRLDRGEKLREKLTPVLNLLTESSRAHRETRRYLRSQVLPPLRDVLSRPEVGSTLRNKLVRLMTHVDTDVKHCAAELLFVLCKENVSRFVKYTGYGNAAGLLAARGLLAGSRGGGGEGQYSEDSDSDTEEYREARSRINPVTGRVEEQQPDPLEGLSEEEKEEEARRLVSMLNRLARDQIIEPVGVMEDGRLAPLGGRRRNCTPDTLREEPEEGDGESERDSD
ncbi:synembryn-A isoform X3 [Lepisosteus oculatus]|uniref:synembryn-A isoform X3 n=1 Tax=Lepisosteus oculatus TaxID=7918 RepID=UPI0037129264